MGLLFNSDRFPSCTISELTLTYKNIYVLIVKVLYSIIFFATRIYKLLLNHVEFFKIGLKVDNQIISIFPLLRRKRK